MTGLTVTLSALILAASALGGNWNVRLYPLLDWLPGNEGYTWSYWGFAEYGHRVSIDGIERISEGIVYRVSGMIEDVSDGESGADYSMGFKYIVTDNSLVMVQQSSRAMDNDFPRMELLRLPLEQGGSWVQTVTDWSGHELTLLCEIENLTENSVTVRYSDTEGPFYQLRELEKGTGVVTFEKLYLMPVPEDEAELMYYNEGGFEMGYTLYRGDY